MAGLFVALVPRNALRYRAAVDYHAELLKQVAEVEGQITQAIRHIREQQALIKDLTRKRRDPKAALELLRTLEAVLALHLQRQARLRREIERNEPRYN